MSSSSAPVRAADPPRLVTDTDVVDMLRQIVTREGTQRAAAARLGFNHCLLSSVLGGRRAPTAQVYRAVGVERLLVLTRGCPDA